MLSIEKEKIPKNEENKLNVDHTALNGLQRVCKKESKQYPVNIMLKNNKKILVNPLKTWNEHTQKSVEQVFFFLWTFFYFSHLVASPSPSSLSNKRMSEEKKWLYKKIPKPFTSLYILYYSLNDARTWMTCKHVLVLYLQKKKKKKRVGWKLRTRTTSVNGW